MDQVLKDQLAAALAAQLVKVQANRDKSLSSVTSRSLDFNKVEDVQLFLDFQAGKTNIIDRDAIVKQPSLFKTVYCTVTGTYAGRDENSAVKDDAVTVHLDSNKKEYRKRALYVDIASGGATMLFFNEYLADFPDGIKKGTVISTKAIAFAKDSRAISKGRGETFNLTTYTQDAWWAFNAFGHQTSSQELAIMATTKSTTLKGAIAEIE